MITLCEVQLVRGSLFLVRELNPQFNPEQNGTSLKLIIN